MFADFVEVVLRLVRSGRWADLAEFFSLTREILATPVMKITVGHPKDKELT